MDGRDLRLTRIMESDSVASEIVKDHLLENGSSVGAKVILNEVKYKITDGNLDHVYKRMENFKKKMIEEYDLKN